MNKLKISGFLLPAFLLANTLQAEPLSYQVEVIYWDNSVFYGKFDYDAASKQIMNLRGLIDDVAMGNIEPIRYQLDAKQDGKGGITASAYSMNSTRIATGPNINNNAYATINFNAADPTLGVTDENELGYMDCSGLALMYDNQGVGHCMYHVPTYDPIYFPMGGENFVLSETITRIDNEISAADCLFNWAENNYPELFSPALGVTNSKTLPPYYFRHYAQANVYLGISATDNHIYYLDANNELQDVGASYDWLEQAECN